MFQAIKDAYHAWFRMPDASEVHDKAMQAGDRALAARNAELTIGLKNDEQDGEFERDRASATLAHRRELALVNAELELFEAEAEADEARFRVEMLRDRVARLKLQLAHGI